MEFVSQGKLLTYLRNHRNDCLKYIDNDFMSRSAFINNNNYMTYYPNNSYGLNEINRKSLNEKKTLSAYDLIQFAYQISKGMEFISSHGVNSIFFFLFIYSIK